MIFRVTPETKERKENEEKNKLFRPNGWMLARCIFFIWLPRQTDEVTRPALCVCVCV